MADPLPGMPDPDDQTTVTLGGKDVWLDMKKKLKLGKEIAVEGVAIVVEVGDKDTPNGVVHIAKLKLLEGFDPVEGR